MDDLEQAIKDFVTEQVPGKLNFSQQRVPDEKVRALAGAIRSEIDRQVADILKSSGLWD